MKGYIIKSISKATELNTNRSGETFVSYIVKGGFVRLVNEPIFPHNLYKNRGIATRVMNFNKKSDGAIKNKYWNTEYEIVEVEV